MELVDRAGIIGPDGKTPHGGREPDIEGALRVIGAPDELGLVPQVAYPDVMGADRAGAEGQLLRCLLHDLLADLPLVGFELIKDRVEHPPGFGHDIVPAPVLLLDLLHMLLKRLGHGRPGDGIGMPLQGLGDCPADQRGAERGSFDILAGEEFLDHFVPGAFGPESKLLHLLDQLALGESCRRLCLLLFEGYLPDGELLADLHGGEYILCRGTVGVDLPPAGLDKLPSGSGVGLLSSPEVHLHRLPACVGREGGEEPPDHEFVDLPPLFPKGVTGCGRGGVDGRVVGARLLPTGRYGSPVGGDPGHLLFKLGRGECLQHSPKVKGSGIDGVVRPGIGDVPVHVQVLCNPHCTGSRESETGGSHDEPRGVERDRGPFDLGAFLYFGHYERRMGTIACLYRLCLVAEPGGGMACLDLLAILLGQERELPVLLGDELLDLLLPVHYHGEGGGLDPADGKDVAAPPPGGKADEPGEGSPPHQVDHLPGFPCRGEVKIEFRGSGECLPDLIGGDRTEPGSPDGNFPAHMADQLVRLLPDQLPFGIKISRYRDEAGLLCQFLEDLDDLLLGRDLDRPGVDQGPGGPFGAPPVGVPLFKIDLDHVASEPDDRSVAEPVDRDPPVLVGGHFCFPGKDGGDAVSRDILLGNDQVHRFSPLFRGFRRAPGSRQQVWPGPWSFS